MLALAKAAGLPGYPVVLSSGLAWCPLAGQCGLSPGPPGVSLTKTTSQSAARAQTVLMVLMHLESHMDLTVVETWTDGLEQNLGRSVRVQVAQGSEPLVCIQLSRHVETAAL